MATKKKTVKTTAKTVTPVAEGSSCSECFGRHLLVSAVLIAAYTWIFDALVQGKIFMDYYTETAALWRPQADMQNMMQYCILFHFVMAYLVTKGFFFWRKTLVVGAVGSSNCPYRKGLGYGLWIGTIMGAGWASMYIFLPLPEKLPLMWFVTSLVKWMLGGFLLTKLYDWKAASGK